MSISKADLDFESNIVLFSGKSASGKSSILDALALCLSSKKRSSLYAEYVKQGKQHAKVILDCDINGKPVNFNLQLNLVKGTPYQMELTYEGKIYKNTEAEEVIKGFDLEYYSDIIFSMQGDSDITQLSPTQRANYLQRLLNFDFVEQKDKIRKYLEEFKNQLQKIESNIGVKKQFIKKEEDEEETLLRVILTDEKIKTIQKSIKEKQDKISQYQQSQQLVINLNNENAKISKELLALNLEDNRITNALNNIKEKQEVLDDLETDLSEATLELTTKETELSDLLAKIGRRKEEEQTKRDKVFEIQHELDYKQKLIPEHHRFAQLEETGKCPVCEQDTSEQVKKKLEEMLQMCDQHNVKYKGGSFKANYEILEEEVRKLENEKSEVELFMELIKCENERSISDKIVLETNIKQLKISIEKYKKSLEAVTDNFDNSLDLKEELKEVKNKEKELKTHSTEIEKEIKRISKNEDITSLNNEIIEDTQKIDKHFALIKTNEEITERNEKRLVRIEEYEQQIKEYETQSTELISKQNTYEDAFNILDKILPNYMVIKTCASLQNEMNIFIQSVFPTYEVELQNSKKGVEFFYTKDNTLKQEGKKNNHIINSKMSSGFEKALLTLAFKVSLANLYHCDILILDEADGAADDESSLKLYDTLINNNFSQVFIISHKNELKDFLQENCDNITTYNVENGTFRKQDS